MKRERKDILKIQIEFLKIKIIAKVNMMLMGLITEYTLEKTYKE